MIPKTLLSPAAPTQRRSAERQVIDPNSPTGRELIPEEIDWEPRIVTPPPRHSEEMTIDFLAGGRRGPQIADDIQDV